MDKKQDELKHNYGLVGKDISYSFSRAYFEEKFENENLDCTYVNFDIEHISDFDGIIKKAKNLKGLNVTIPYKEAVISKLDKINKRAAKIGAVNTIKITKKNKLIGYNTDYYGFKKSLLPLLEKHHNNALIFGTGGASKAIAHVFKNLGIHYNFVSRLANQKATYTYSQLTKEIIHHHKILVNCTPLGTYPNIDECPNIPYDAIEKDHLLYDLVYNPETTKFLYQGQKNGAKTINGRQMLIHQAEKSWKICQND
ncbi:MAG: shikimate dehydrogenase [Winogradskyella sp.]|nr:shikimate dehydrogenase [Winogradskyella sp.]